jgi:hypothetical protein
VSHLFETIERPSRVDEGGACIHCDGDAERLGDLFSRHTGTDRCFHMAGNAAVTVCRHCDRKRDQLPGFDIKVLCLRARCAPQRSVRKAPWMITARPRLIASAVAATLYVALFCYQWACLSLYFVRDERNSRSLCANDSR